MRWFLPILLIPLAAQGARFQKKLLDFERYPATLEHDNGVLLYGKAQFKQKRRITFTNEDGKVTELSVRVDCITPATDGDIDSCWPRLKVQLEGTPGVAVNKSAILRIRDDVKD